MQITDKLNNLEEKFNDFSDDVVRIQHEHELLKKKHEESEKLVIKYEQDKETHTKAVELLAIVQTVTRDKIKDGFESIASWALKSIFQKDYKFCLEFGRRGNLSELYFAIKTPDLQEAFDPMDTSGGGVLNVVSLVLRLILMEISVPKIQGFIILDESFKNVNGQDNIDRLNNFVEEMSSKFNRQIIHVTDMPVFKSNSNYNLIEIK